MESKLARVEVDCEGPEMRLHPQPEEVDQEVNRSQAARHDKELGQEEDDPAQSGRSPCDGQGEVNHGAHKTDGHHTGDQCVDLHHLPRREAHSQGKENDDDAKPNI